MKEVQYEQLGKDATQACADEKHPLRIVKCFCGFKMERLAAREAKLIADTLRSAADAADKVARKFMEFADDTVKMAIGDIERSVGASKARSAILALIPAQIAAQAEERDRRVAAEAHTQGQRDMREQIFQACDGEGYIHRSEISNQRLATLRAAVQEGKDDVLKKS